MTPFHEDVLASYNILRSGGVVLVPTDAGYGLLAMGPSAVDRIFQLKGRPRSKPCVAVAPWPVFDAITPTLAPSLRSWLVGVARQSPLAVVAPLTHRAPLIRNMPAAVRDAATRDDTVAAFLSAGEFVNSIAARAFADGHLVVGSSANLSGTGNHARLRDVPMSIRAGVDGVVDHGPGRHADPNGRATTILDLGSGRFLREGIHFEKIASAWAAYGAEVDAPASPSRVARAG